MKQTHDEIAHSLRRLADYGQALAQPDRDLLKTAADALPTSATPARDFQTLADLVSLLADPAATKKRLQEIVTTTADAAATITAASDAAANLEAKKAEWEAELSEHRRMIATERGAHAADLHRREQAVKGQEIQAAELLAQAKTDAAAAADLRADLQGRLDAINKLATK